MSHESASRLVFLDYYSGDSFFKLMAVLATFRVRDSHVIIGLNSAKFGITDFVAD